MLKYLECDDRIVPLAGVKEFIKCASGRMKALALRSSNSVYIDVHSDGGNAGVPC
jgi:hypothetical protein